MSIIYTGEFAMKNRISISARAFDAEHGSPSVLLRIDVHGASFTLHLSPDDAEAMALRISQAASIACKVGEKA